MLVLDDELGLCDLRNSPLANTAKLPDAFANGIIREEANVLEDAEITPIKSNDGDDETKSQFNDGQAISVETIKSSKAIVLPSDITDDKSRIPLCKCPDCDKSFHALRKLYGHYGSSHAKTNGMKIDKKNIQYACPFCTSDTPVEVSEYHQFKQLSKVVRRFVVVVLSWGVLMRSHRSVSFQLDCTRKGEPSRLLSSDSRISIACQHQDEQIYHPQTQSEVSTRWKGNYVEATS
jgi:hypothetical protein